MSFTPDTKHPPIKWFRKILNSKKNKSNDHCLVEGWKCCDEAWTKQSPTAILITEKASQRWPSTWERQPTENTHIVDERTMTELCSTSQPEGILASFPRPELNPWTPDNEGLHLALYQWRDPSNVGSVVRSARGLGVRSITMIGPGPDFFSPKVIRSSMGSVFHTRLHRNDTASLNSEKPLFLAAAGGTPIDQLHLPQNPILVLGSESHGLPEDIQQKGQRVGIPLTGGLESLSAPIAAAILIDQIQKKLKPIW